MEMELTKRDLGHPPQIFAIFLGLIALPLIVGGVWLAAIGGSAYYMLAGAATGGSGWLLWHGDRRGTWLYGTMLSATALWAIWESGQDGWALAPRLIGPCVIGLWLLTPFVQRGLCTPPLFCLPRRMGWVVTAAILIGIAMLAIGQRGPSVAPSSDAASAMIPPNVANTDWPVWGGDAAGTRYSALDQINPANVGKLSVAWTFHTGPMPSGPKGGLETTPIKIGDTMYLCDGANRVFALDPDTGKQKWKFDPKVDVKGLIVATCRGVAYHRVADASAGSVCAQRIYMSSIDAGLWALDARTGRPCPEFAVNGRVDLKRGMGRHIQGYYSVTSAPTIVRGRIIIGGWVTDNQSLGEPSGVVRAYDAITGDLTWAWDMGRPGQTGEPRAGEHYTQGTPNVWAPPSADETLGLVYLPTGNATPDFWGGKRTAEMDHFSSATVALDAETGAVRWSFQTTHHDVWDYDVASQPTLVDIPGPDGTIIPALIQPTKRAETFLLDRRTGRPIAPVEERPVPTAPGDRLSPTQPYSSLPSFKGPDLTEKMMWGMTPIDQLWCRIKFRQARYDGEFTPPSTKAYIEYPGHSGGSSWGGISFDPVRRVMAINVNRFAQYNRLVPRAEANHMGMHPVSDAIGGGLLGSPQMGTPFGVVDGPFISPLGVPCQQPPFGMIGVMDLTKRKIAWTHVLGTARDSGPFGIPIGLPIPLGTPNTGGTMMTRAGLIFIGATQERNFRALDVRTGHELWNARLPSGAQATPMTYRSNRTGRQYVAIAAGGNILLGSRQGDSIIAYALSK